jgi:Amt family ammonium transporter
MQFVINCMGAGFGATWSFGMNNNIRRIQDAIWPGGVRVTPKEEEIGLDISQVGERAYSGFAE